MATDLKCPNCGTPAAGEAGSKIVCATCGGTFEFVAGEARLTGVGEVDKLKETVTQHDADIAEIKQRLPGSTPAADPDEPAAVDPDDDDDEEDDL
jgi:uncharacterized Zn finger protein (UPF0148 family)